VSRQATVRVALSERSYQIRIGSGVIGSLGEFTQECRSTTHAAVITDSNVEPRHADAAVASLQSANIRTDLLTVPAGEASKSIGQLGDLWNQLLAAGADRKSVVVALGGGVVGDLAGFAAASYGRGLPFIQVPTSLLAQVDSSVGGKTGINLPGAKNMVGAFWQPSGVLIDIDTLATLPDREYLEGMAEVVKYGMILDEAFLAYLEANVDRILSRDADVLREIVAKSCRYKADVVEADEREESGRRAILNYGHTFCHAIEAVAGYGEYLHGEAVSIGMLCASRLAELLGRIGSDVTERQLRLLTALKLPVDVPDLDRDALLSAMQRDKKVEHGKLRFILPSRIGEVELVGDVPVELVRKAWGG